MQKKQKGETKRKKFKKKKRRSEAKEIFPLEKIVRAFAFER